MNDKTKLFQKKIDQWTCTIQTRFLSNNKLLLDITSTVMKSVEYPLYTTTFIQEEINRLICPIHDLVLPRYKLCRKLSLVLTI